MDPLGDARGTSTRCACRRTTPAPAWRVAALGVAQYGGPFVLDPFDAYGAGLVSNPNVVVAGSIGAGKSTVVKMMVDRALERGRRVVVVDPKGEYADLARGYGVASMALGRDGWCDPFPDDLASGRSLVRAVLASAHGGVARRRGPLPRRRALAHAARAASRRACSRPL